MTSIFFNRWRAFVANVDSQVIRDGFPCRRCRV